MFAQNPLGGQSQNQNPTLASISNASSDCNSAERKRFHVELEFVQCLANPHYLNFLAQRDYFKDDCFKNYLKYLLYWKRPEYARYLKYPQCLKFLELCQFDEFTEALKITSAAQFIEEQQILQWQYYLRKRQRLQTVNEAEAEKLLKEAVVSATVPPNKFWNGGSPILITSKGPRFIFAQKVAPRFPQIGDGQNQLGDSLNTVAYASKCEICLLVVVELENALEVTGRTNEVLETASGKRVAYKRSLTRFHDVVESVCAKFLRYTVHKEYGSGSDVTIKRFAPGRSETMRTLHGLVEKGVKVELGMPYEMWDAPSVEISHLKAGCETLLEEYESDLEQFYWDFVGADEEKRPLSIDLRRFLCVDRFLASLKRKDRNCLSQYDVVKRHIADMEAKIESRDPRNEL